MQEEKQEFHRPYVVKIAKRYLVSYRQARPLFSALMELSRCTSEREITRVQSFCFYMSGNNNALGDLYIVISKVMGAYDPKGRKPVFKLRPKKRRDAYSAEDAALAMRLTREALSFFELPPDALVKSVISLPVLRHSMFRHAVKWWDGDVLAHTLTHADAVNLERLLRLAGDTGRRKVERVSQVDFVKSLSVGFKGAKRMAEALGDQLYALARLVISDTVYQAAGVVGYLRLSYPDLASILRECMPETDLTENFRTANRLPPSIRPHGEQLGVRGIKAAVKAVEALARDELVSKVLACDMSQSERRMLEVIKGLLPNVSYKGRLSLRDRTSTRFNYKKVAEYIELDDLDKTIAIVTSKINGQRIVKAEEYLGRKAALERANAVIDAYLSADDLI